MKKLIFPIIFLSIACLINIKYGQAVIQNEDNKLSQEDNYALIRSPLKILPSETILLISERIYGEDFQSLALTCWPIRNILMSCKKFFMPEKKEEVINIIKKASFEEIPQYILIWGRGKNRKNIDVLRNTLSSFEDFFPPNEGGNLKYCKENFKNYIKNLNLLYGLGDFNSKLIFKSTYRKIEDEIENIVDYEDGSIENETLYVFYYKNISLLNPKIRNNIAFKYEKGIIPFKKNSLKGKKYSEPLKLPLSIFMPS